MSIHKIIILFITTLLISGCGIVYEISGVNNAIRDYYFPNNQKANTIAQINLGYQKSMSNFITPPLEAEA